MQMDAQLQQNSMPELVLRFLVTGPGFAECRLYGLELVALSRG